MARLNDLVRCEDAIKEICKRTCTPGVFCPDAYCKEVKEWITDDMVVDAVEVVRCKDCKYNSNPPECGNAVCDCFYGMTDQMGFCHYGERREQDGKDGDHHD